MISFLFRRLPLCFVFIAPFVIQIVCIVGIVGWLSYRNGEKAVSEISAQLQEEINVRVQERLETFHLKNKFGSEIGKNGSRQTVFSIDGEKHLVSMTPMRFDENLEFITVPESDFMGQINKNFQITVLLCLLALLVSVIIGIVTAGWVTAPIIHLSSSAKALAEGDWESTVHIDRSDELGELGKAYNSMSRQLRNIFQTLDDRVHERTSELADANSQLKDAKEKAEAANHAKSAFLATMSHELRTPLNGILGYAHILRQDAGAEQKKGLIIIEQSGKHLLSLINDILDLAKVESGRIELFPTEFHFPSILTGISAMIRIRAEKKWTLFQP